MYYAELNIAHLLRYVFFEVAWTNFVCPCLLCNSQRYESHLRYGLCWVFPPNRIFLWFANMFDIISEKQKDNVAKFLYDVAKITLATLVLSPFTNKAPMKTWILVSGTRRR